MTTERLPHGMSSGSALARRGLTWPALIAAATLLLPAACAGPGIDPPASDAGFDAGQLPDAGVSGGDAGVDAGSSLIRQVYEVTVLASNGAPAAPQMDPTLVNGWGLAAGAASPLWVASRDASAARSYDPSGTPASAAVRIPAPPSKGAVSARPTGIAFNGERTFRGDTIITVTDTGTIQGWQSGDDAIIRVDNSSSQADYKGVALVRTPTGDRLFVTNFHAGVVEIYDADYTPIGTFTDPLVPKDFVPFNAILLDGDLCVTFARTDDYRQNDLHAVGNGYVDIFDLTGQLKTRLIETGVLNSPYGVAHSPVDFGRFSDVLLVANVGDGRINAFDPVHGDLLGRLELPGYDPLVVSRIHGILFGNDGGAGAHNQLFFTAGPNDGANGVLGSIIPTF